MVDTMRERVTLPDSDSGRLVHPMEVPEARGAYRTALALSLMGSAEVLVLIAAVAWAATDSYVAPTLALLSTGVIAELARRHHHTEAWAYIPRRRQDATRPDPWRWELLRALTLPGSFVAGVVIVLVNMAELGVDAGVKAWSIGSAAGLGVALVLASAVSMRSRRGSITGRISLAAALLSVLLGALVLRLGGWVPADPDPVPIALGALVPLAIYAVWGWATRIA